jgi:hypothetical protein
MLLNNVKLSPLFLIQLILMFMPTHEFQKMNNEQHFIFDDVMYKKNKILVNQYTCSLQEVLTQVKLSH